MKTKSWEDCCNEVGRKEELTPNCWKDWPYLFFKEAAQLFRDEGIKEAVKLG